MIACAPPAPCVVVISAESTEAPEMAVMESVASAKTTTTVDARKAVTTPAKTTVATAKATPVPAATPTTGADQHERAACCSQWPLRAAKISRLCKCGSGGKG